MSTWKRAAEAPGARYAVLIAGGSLLIILVGLVLFFGVYEKTKPRFDAIPGARDMTADELAEYVDVRRIDMVLSLGDDRATGRRLAEFIATPHSRSFSAVTNQNWEARWNRYAAKLVERAEEAGLPHQSLATCLQKIGPPGGVARLPVAAYLVGSDGGDLWMISCVWEAASDRPMGLGHIRGWIFRVSDQSQVDFTTCS